MSIASRSTTHRLIGGAILLVGIAALFYGPSLGGVNLFSILFVSYGAVSVGIGFTLLISNPSRSGATD